MMVISVVLIISACGGDDTDPAATVESYIEAYNAGDIDLIMSHFIEDSVIFDHSTSFVTTTGLEEILRMHNRDFSFGNGYTISNVETSGDTVTWDSVWGDNFGCVEGHTTVVEDDKMLTWAWGTQFDCP
jgi:hypothetical protein